MKYLLIFTLLISNVFFAQTRRFIYEYRFVPDRNKTDSIIIENTRLEIFSDHSEFLSDLTARKDSVLNSLSQEKQQEANVQLKNGIYTNQVYKSKKLTYTTELIGIQPYKVIRNSDFKWKLLSEKRIIQGYECQKATLNYAGRQWEAWFTTEIPISEGPYLFNALPGLIVKMSDTKNQHSFLLVGNYKSDNNKSNIFDKPYYLSAKVSEALFNKKWNIFKKNPIGGTDQFMIMNPGLLSGVSFDEDGNKLDFREMKRKEQKFTEKMIRENNNPLDLELYK